MEPVVICVPQGAVGTSVALPKDILGAAAQAAAERTGSEPDPVLLVSADGGPVVCRAGLRIDCDAALSEVSRCKLAWVAGYATELVAGAAENMALVEWLAQRNDGQTLIAGNGPGTYLLAEAGLLKGRIATTYRPQAAEFRRRHPEVDLQPDRLITDAGGVFCCVGVNSASDLLVTLAGKLYGRGVAASVAAWALVDSQRSYRVAMTAFDGQKYHGDGDILEIQVWLEENFERPITIGHLATVFAMSTRTLIRRFRAATGTPPGRYLARLRVEAAKDLLQNSNLTVSEVAARVGYRDVGAFYDLFTMHTGTKPGAFRAGGRV